MSGVDIIRSSTCGKQSEANKSHRLGSEQPPCLHPPRSQVSLCIHSFAFRFCVLGPCCPHRTATLLLRRPLSHRLFMTGSGQGVGWGSSRSYPPAPQFVNFGRLRSRWLQRVSHPPPQPALCGASSWPLVGWRAVAAPSPLLMERGTCLAAASSRAPRFTGLGVSLPRAPLGIATVMTAPVLRSALNFGTQQQLI